MNYIENLGLDFLMDTEESTKALVGAVCTEGRATVGYYGYPYFNNEFGWAQFVVRSKLNEEKKRFEITGLDTHVSGVAQWTFEITTEMSTKNNDPLEKRVMIHKLYSNSGMAVVNLINADVLPSFLENDVITAQMIGFPIDIHYYETEDDYADAQPEMKDGNKMLLGDGTVFPIGLFNENKTEDSDNYMLIRGTVKKAVRGEAQFGEEKVYSFLDVLINTEFGDLEIIHTFEQMYEEERHLVKEGSVVSGAFVLSGDVAIDEYENGLIKDFDRNLALLRYTLTKGDPKRLAAILTADAEYYSEASKQTFKGKKEIIKRMQYVRDCNPETEFFVHNATIISIDDGNEKLPYDVGTKCLVLAMNDKNNLVSICFIECNEQGEITKIHITENGRYHFQLEEHENRPSILEDLEVPDDIRQSILSRAKFHGFIDHEIKIEDVIKFNTKVENYSKYVDNLIENFPELENDIACENMFGYLFASAIEAAIEDDAIFPEENYDAECVFPGLYEPFGVSEVVEEKLENMFDLGKQFYKDFKFHNEIKNYGIGDYYGKMVDALIFVQQIGEMYGKTKFGENK